MEIKNKIKSIAIKSILLSTLITVLPATNVFASDNNDTGSDYSSSEETTADTIAQNSVVDNKSLAILLYNNLLSSNLSYLKITGLKALNGSLILNGVDLINALGIYDDYKAAADAYLEYSIVKRFKVDIHLGNITSSNNNYVNEQTRLYNIYLELLENINNSFFSDMAISQSKILTTGSRITLTVDSVFSKTLTFINQYADLDTISDKKSVNNLYKSLDNNSVSIAVHTPTSNYKINK